MTLNILLDMFSKRLGSQYNHIKSLLGADIVVLSDTEQTTVLRTAESLPDKLANTMKQIITSPSKIITKEQLTAYDAAKRSIQIKQNIKRLELCALEGKERNLDKSIGL